MDLFLFLITIFCLPLITSTQPFIDCSGKSFLCENSTHFTICVDVGGGLSMTVGNIVLACPSTTFCDENNAFECEYRTSTLTTPSPISQSTDIPTGATEARFTTNVYDEFLFTSDSQQAEESIIFPTQQKYIIPGNANVIFDDTDNAVLVYGNIDSETVKTTPVYEKVINNINSAKSEDMEVLENKNPDAYKKFTRRNKESTLKLEEARDELSTTIVQTTDTTDEIMTTFSESSGSVTTEESSTVEYVTTTKNIEISVTPSIFVPDIGSNLLQMANYTSSSKNDSENIIRNDKNVDSTTNFTLNKLAENDTSSNVMEINYFNTLESNSTISDTVSNTTMYGNISQTDEIFKVKTNETSQKNNQTDFKNNPLKDNEDIIALQSTTEVFTDATLDLNIPTERSVQNTTYSNANSTNSTHIIETIPPSPDESIKLNLNIPTENFVQNDTLKDILNSNSTKLFDATMSTPYDKLILKSSTTTERYAENATISYDILSDASTDEIETFSTTPYKIVTSNSSTTAENYAQNDNLSKEIIPLNSSEQQIQTTSAISNKTTKYNLSTPSTGYVQNATLPKDLSSSSTHLEPISTTPVDIVTSNVNNLTESYAQSDTFSTGIIIPNSLDFNSGPNLIKRTTSQSNKLRDVENKILSKNPVHPTTTVKNVTSHLSTTTETYILNGMSNPVIPSESSESDITFGDILKVNKDSIDLKSILDSTVKPNTQDSNYTNRPPPVTSDNMIDIVSNNVIATQGNEIITDNTMLGMEYPSSKLNTIVKTITEFTTENIDESQQKHSYQTTLSTNNLVYLKNILFEDADYSILLFPPRTVESLVTELSTTPQPFTESNINANPFNPNDSPDFDISFGDLIKANKDFIELKAPPQISLTDFNERSENHESLRNFRSTSQSDSLNYDLASNSSEKLTKHNSDIFNSTEVKTYNNISATNITVNNESFVNNEKVILGNESLNKDLLLNNTSIPSNLSLPAINTINSSSSNNPAKVHHEIIEKIKNPDNIISQNLNSTNHVLKITTHMIEDKKYPNSNKTMESSTYIPIDENRTIDKVQMSNEILKNVTGRNYKKQNEKEMEEIEIVDTATLNVTRKDNKIIKRTDSELVNDTINELTYTTQSTTKTSNSFTNTESTTMKYNKSGNKTINSSKTNTSDVFNKVILQNNTTEAITPGNNAELLNINTVVPVEDVTKPISNITSSIDLINNVTSTEATVSISVSNDQTKEITEKAYLTEVPIPHSSTLVDEPTDIQPAILFNGNTDSGLNTSIIIKDIDEKIEKAYEMNSPKYNLSNRLLSISTISSPEQGDTSPNETNKNVPYLTVSEKDPIDKLPMSSVLLENTTVGNYKNLYEKDIGVVDLTGTDISITDNEQKSNKIIKRTDNELLNHTLNVLNSSTLSTLETSYYISNTEGITVSYDKFETTVSLKNNTAKLLQGEKSNNRETAHNISAMSSVKAVTELALDTYSFTSNDLIKNATITVAPITNSVISNNQTEKNTTKKYTTEVTILNSPVLDMLKRNKFTTKKNMEAVNDTFYNTENTTEHSLQTSTTNSSKNISNIKLIKSNETAILISRLLNTERQETNHTKSPTLSVHKKVAIVNSSMIIKNKLNRRGKQNVTEDKRNENVKQFASNKVESVTRTTLKKPKLTTSSFIIDKSNDSNIARVKAEKNTTKLYTNPNNSTEHNISTYFEPTSTIPYTLMTTEKLHLTTERENSLKTTESLSVINETSTTKTTTYKTYKKKKSNKRNYQNTLYDAFVNSISKDLEPTLPVVNTTHKNEHQTTLRLEEDDEEVSEDDLGQDDTFTTMPSTKLLTTSNSLNSKNSTFSAFNKTNYSIKNTNNKTSKISFIDKIPLVPLHTTESDINVATDNISNVTVNKLEKINGSRGELMSKVHNITTKSIDNISKVQEEIIVDIITDKSQDNIKNSTLREEIKNETTIEKCSDRSFCISQGNEEVSIELFNKTRINVSLRTKTDSKTKNTARVINTTIAIGKSPNNSHINITLLPLKTTNSKEFKIENKNEMPTKQIQTKSPLILQNSEFQSQTNTSKINIVAPISGLIFDCRNHSRGRYADKDNCKKFYICIGVSMPIVGFCPQNTVFSEFKKQCTNNLSHCIRNNQFKCVKDGRFIDVWKDNTYYVCVKGPHHRFLRLKLQCKSGYVLDKVNVMCKQGLFKRSSSTSSNSSSSSSSSSSSDKKKSKRNKKATKSSNETGFKCNEEGKFVDPNNCKKYYVCSKTSKSVLHRKRKKCDSDEVFDDDKKKCVDEDSYECK